MKDQQQWQSGQQYKLNSACLPFNLRLDSRSMVTSSTQLQQGEQHEQETSHIQPHNVYFGLDQRSGEYGIEQAIEAMDIIQHGDNQHDDDGVVITELQSLFGSSRNNLIPNKPVESKRSPQAIVTKIDSTLKMFEVSSSMGSVNELLMPVEISPSQGKQQKDIFV